MTTHEQVDELIAAFALGAVDNAEAAMVRRHLPDCPVCQATLVRMSEVAAVLPLSLEEVAPPDGFRDRLLDRLDLRGTSAPARPTVLEGGAQGRPAAAPGRLRLLPRVPAWAPVAAAAALVAVMFGWGAALTTLHPGPAPSTLQATLVDSHHGQVGSVTYVSGQSVAVVTFKQLAQPSGGKTYELWVIPKGGNPIPAGVFLPQPDGSGGLVIHRAVAHGDTVAVTEEAPGGAPQPTGAPVVTGQL